MERKKLYKSCCFEVGPTGAENLSAHGMSGVLRERAYERGRESCLSVEPESHAFTPKFSEEAAKQEELLKGLSGIQGEFMLPSVVCQIKVLCG